MRHPKPTPRLRLFISTDIVNSTSFKQNSSRGEELPQPWLSTFNDFFVSVQEYLEAEFEKLRAQENNLDLEIGECPTFWKAAGDEVILTKEITHEDQAYIALHLFLLALSKVRKSIRAVGLDVKCTAWLAGFPINNAEFVIGQNRKGDSFPGMDDHNYSHYVYLERHNENPSPGAVLDFIGPQMDLGFRLASLATSRKLVLSLDLAWMIISTFLKKDLYHKEFIELEGKIRFEGTQSLKGVLSGTPYPIFWLDTMPDYHLNSAEDTVTNNPPPSLATIQNYCVQFFEHHSEGWLHTPFVCKETTDLSGIPEKFRNPLLKLHERLEKDTKKFTYEQRNLLEQPSTQENQPEDQINREQALILLKSTLGNLKK